MQVNEIGSRNWIYEIRGERVIIDRDLAALYEVETKALNLAIKMNGKRFPKDFMFQLTKEEFEMLRFQIATNRLAKEMDVLAKQVIAVYKEDDERKYLANLFRFQILAGEYSQAIATIDSLRINLSLSSNAG